MLENGIRLLICRRPETPVAAVTIWVRVGYFDENDDEAGLSHVIEHMYFQGSDNYRGPAVTAEDPGARLENSASTRSRTSPGSTAPATEMTIRSGT